MRKNNVNFEKMFGLPSSSKDDDFDLEPPAENSYAEHGVYRLVGHGEITNDYCGKFIRVRGCVREDLHRLITLDGKNYEGKMYGRKVHHFCNKPSYPVCFKSGWVVREAGNITSRLEEASKRFGQVEHIVCSIPSADYGLSLEALRKKAVKVLLAHGVIGGVLIFHAFRYNLRDYWYFSPHFHVLGFILGGFVVVVNVRRKVVLDVMIVMVLRVVRCVCMRSIGILSRFWVSVKRFLELRSIN